MIAVDVQNFKALVHQNAEQIEKLTATVNEIALRQAEAIGERKGQIKRIEDRRGIIESEQREERPHRR